MTRTKADNNSADSDTDNDDTDSGLNNGQSDDDNDASSSEVDEDESDRRKAILLNDLTELERQFLQLREKLYLARKESVIAKLAEVKAERAPEYLQPKEDLLDQMRIRTEVAGILKELRLENIRCQFEAEQYAAEQNYESEKQSIINQIRSDIEDKLRRLDEDRNSIDSLWALNNETSSTKFPEHFVGTRDHLFVPDRRRKPVSVTGPYIIYMLREHEILEDHALIKKALKSEAFGI